MELITFSGPPSSGKTSAIIHTVREMKKNAQRVGVIKMDCLSTDDHLIYEKEGIPVQVGLAGNLCPDHFFVCNIEDCMAWGEKMEFDYLITESAGLCNRCSPHIKGRTAVCVIDNLMGVNTPKKVGPMLKMADLVVITKGDIVSQAEREVFAFRVRMANAKAVIMQVNGITGQGCYELASLIRRRESRQCDTMKLRFAMPAALCSYCLGETEVGKEFQMGNIRKMVFK